MSMIPRSTAVRRSTHSTDVFAFDGVVGEGNGCIARVGLGWLPCQSPSSPCTMIHSVVSSEDLSLSAKLSFAVDRQTVQLRRSDIEDDVHVPADSDKGIFGWHLLVWPSGRIRPAPSRW